MMSVAEHKAVAELHAAIVRAVGFDPAVGLYPTSELLSVARRLVDLGPASLIGALERVYLAGRQG